jgi:uncharacterized membrane protein (UPF0127 family)
MTKTTTPLQNKSKQQIDRFKSVIIIAMAAIVVLLGVMVVLIARQNHTRNLGNVTVNGTIFEVEIVADDASRQVGLMFRKTLPERHGMLFIFDRPDIYPFWMRNTPLSLDIIYIDENKKVINICTMPPETDEHCSPVRPALYVLEIEAGEANRYGIEPGMTMDFDLPKGF